MARRLTSSRKTPGDARASHGFEIECRCGEMISGQRQLTGQSAMCSGCGQRVFVLPVDQYRNLSERELATPSANNLTMIDRLNRLGFWTRLRAGRHFVTRKIADAFQGLMRRFSHRKK